MVDYLHESASTIYRRRRHRRAVATLFVVSALLGGTIAYGFSYVQGWLPNSTPKSLVSPNCSVTKFKPLLRPRDVIINVYNATPTAGLASRVARTLEQRGFTVGTVDNDPLGQTVLKPAEIRHGQGGAIPAVIAATMLPGAGAVVDDRTDTTIDLVLGKTFNTKRLRLPPKNARFETARLARSRAAGTCAPQVSAPERPRQVSAPDK
jgi:LytR cell envelope-related transcriptional attenuator